METIFRVVVNRDIFYAIWVAEKYIQRYKFQTKGGDKYLSDCDNEVYPDQFRKPGGPSGLLSYRERSASRRNSR
ncbi:hypothetical protein [Sphingobacterium allocomposti]|uniref:hypothetical protein n=1 Tax=Sphingobacterium allocomposti TaxID=415956 RepID=UPI0014784313|nr:hypothetical protein [Sphingobacterium composti Yoo et al. 2007 non Ten et al. 2007]